MTTTGEFAVRFFVTALLACCLPLVSSASVHAFGFLNRVIGCPVQVHPCCCSAGTDPIDETEANPSDEIARENDSSAVPETLTEETTDETPSADVEEAAELAEAPAEEETAPSEVDEDVASPSDLNTAIEAEEDPAEDATATNEEEAAPAAEEPAAPPAEPAAEAVTSPAPNEEETPADEEQASDETAVILKEEESDTSITDDAAPAG